MIFGLSCLLLSEIFTRAFLELPALRRLEFESEGKDVARVRFLLDHIVEGFGVTATEYGAWDDTFNVVQPGTSRIDLDAYANLNLYAQGHSRLKLDGVILTDREGNVLINAVYDPEKDAFTSTGILNPSTLAHGALKRPRIGPNLELVNEGFSDSNVGPVMFAASNVLPSTPPYPAPAGQLIFWRRFKGVSQFMDAGTSASMDFIPFSHARSAPNLKEASLELALNPEIAYLPSDKDGFIKWLLRDVDGSPLFLVRLKAKQRMYEDGLLSQTVLIGFGFSALVLLLSGLAFSRSIIRRLHDAQSVIAEIVESGKFDKRLRTDRSDEIDSLFERFNELLVHIQEQDDRLKTRNQQLEMLSEEDPLTGIPNRRYLDRMLNHGLRQSIRMARPMSFLMVDVDCFKAYNDHYGHQQGDLVLKQVAHTLRAHLHRATDYIARYGGEEFSIILLDTPNSNALGVAESLRAAVENLGLENTVSDCAGVVTVSVGVATAGNNGPTKEAALVLCADKALYRAKETGRNRVCSQPVPPSQEYPEEYKQARV